MEVKPSAGGNTDIMVLKMGDDVYLPVRWSHYASWLAIANYCQQVLAQNTQQIDDESGISIALSGDEFHWGKLSMTLIQKTKDQVPSEPSFQSIFANSSSGFRAEGAIGAG